MTPDEAVKIVKSKANGRTRYEGQVPFLDEVLVGEIERLREAIRLDISDAKVTCGSDGKGCKAFRPYYGDNTERRYRKCGQCPMEVLSNVREATAPRSKP